MKVTSVATTQAVQLAVTTMDAEEEAVGAYSEVAGYVRFWRRWGSADSVRKGTGNLGHRFDDAIPREARKHFPNMQLEQAQFLTNLIKTEYWDRAGGGGNIS